MKWYKMYVNAMNDIKFRKLAKKGNQPFPYYWTAFCIILDRTAVEGTVKYSDADEREIIFERLELYSAEVSDLLEDLFSVDLIEWDEDEDFCGEIRPKNWEKYQVSDYSTERVQKHRVNKEQEEIVDNVIKSFNEMTGKRYNIKTEGTRKLIRGRLEQGYTLEQMKAVVAWKIRDWGNDKKMKTYVRPNTIFRPNNFDNYFNEMPEDIMTATAQGTILRVRDMYGNEKSITPEQYDKATKGYYEIIK